MKLTLKEYQKAEIIHYYDSSNGDKIYSTGNKFTIINNDKSYHVGLELSIANKIAALLRVGRRFFRLDKGNAVLVDSGKAVLFFYRGWIYYYDLLEQSLEKVHRLRAGRNALHCGVLAIAGKHIYFGEYFMNWEFDPVYVFKSSDCGKTWRRAFQTEKGDAFHIHGIYQDRFTGQIWIPFGDFAGQCRMAIADPDFNNVRFIGDGSQDWRAVSLIFSETSVVWGMDSPLVDSHIMHFDRGSEVLTKGQAMPGPVWYSKSLEDGVHLMQTSVEPGPGVKSSKAHIYSSRDLVSWEEVASFEKDSYPFRYFKYGVIAFADGPQTSKNFTFHAEALRGIDGKSFIATLT